MNKVTKYGVPIVVFISSLIFFYIIGYFINSFDNYIFGYQMCGCAECPVGALCDCVCPYFLGIQISVLAYSILKYVLMFLFYIVIPGGLAYISYKSKVKR